MALCPCDIDLPRRGIPFLQVASSETERYCIGIKPFEIELAASILRDEEELAKAVAEIMSTENSSDALEILELDLCICC